jgi:dTDP-4-amino-4,6-dideoxygalactose transaminase
MVPFFDLKRQYREIEDEILSATRRVYGSGRFILGEEVSAFESEFAQYVGVRYGVGVGSGTDALFLALKSIGIGEGDEVATVAHSFIATALAVSFCGARPVFVEIDNRTCTLDPGSLEDLLRKRARRGGRSRLKAVLPVHLYGRPAEMAAISEIADRYGLDVVEDACQAHGAVCGGKKTGAMGRLGCFSFYPTKNLGGYGDGGMVVTDDPKLHERLRLLRCYGEKRKYEHWLRSGNSRLDEVQAALLRVKLGHLDRWNERRRERAGLYASLLAETGISLPDYAGEHLHAWYVYVVRSRQRNRLQTYLKEKGIDTLIHYPVPIHLQRAYRDLGYSRGDLPVTERVSSEVLSLPFFPELTDDEAREVADRVAQFFRGEE